MVRKAYNIAGTSYAVVIPSQLYRMIGNPEYFEFAMEGGKLILIPVDKDAQKKSEVGGEMR